MTQRLAALATAGFLGLFVLVPLGALALSLVFEPATLGTVLDPLNLRAAWQTLALCLGVLAVTLGLGVPLGWVLGRSDLPRAGAWRALCTTPWMVPPYITAIAWISLLNPSNGLLNQVLGGLGLPPLDIYTLAGTVWVMGLSFTPFVLIATADALSRMDASFEEQARVAGAGPLRTLLTVTLPLAVPGVLTGASFVLAASAASFGVPYLLAGGGATPTWVLTTRIYQAIDLAPSAARPEAAALCLVLLCIGLGLPALLSLMRGRRRYTTVTGKATRVAPFELGRARPLAYLLVGGYALVGVVLPVGTIVLTSLLRNIGRGLGPSNLTFANYDEVLFQRSDTLSALGHSLFLATCAATAAVALGLLAAWIGKRASFRGRRVLPALARLPWAVPGTVLALALIAAFSQEVRFIFFERITLAIALMDTLWILGIAYVVKFMAFPVGQTEAGLDALSTELEEAARVGGAGWGRSLRTITLPLLRPNLVAAWFLVFMAAFSEVTLSILLTGPDSEVVGTLLFKLQTYQDRPSAAVLAVVVVGVVLGGNTAVRVASRGRVGL